MLFWHGGAWKSNSLFSFLYKNKLSLDAATAFFLKCTIIPPITPKKTIFEFSDHEVNYHLINYVLLIFTYYVYKAGENLSLDRGGVARNIHKRKENEKQASKNHKKSSGWVQ